MARTTLPKSSEPGAAEASEQLQKAISDPLSVTILVFGEGPKIDQILANVEARASVKSSIRRVVWIPDPSVLSDEQRARYVSSDTVVVAVDGKHGAVAATLTASKARGAFRVDMAFNLAENQLGS